MQLTNQSTLKKGDVFKRIAHETFRAVKDDDGMGYHAERANVQKIERYRVDSIRKGKNGTRYHVTNLDLGYGCVITDFEFGLNLPEGKRFEYVVE